MKSAQSRGSGAGKRLKEKFRPEGPEWVKMSQSLSKVLVHLVFGTKDRVPWLFREVRTELHAYLGGIIRNQGCSPIEIGGVEDHVHVLLGLARTVSAAELVSVLKANSTKWIKSKGDILSAFQWQAGYAVFSVGPPDLDSLRKYIRNQEQHHQARSFQNEYRAFLNSHEIKFDEKYLWD